FTFLLRSVAGGKFPTMHSLRHGSDVGSAAFIVPDPDAYVHNSDNFHLLLQIRFSFLVPSCSGSLSGHALTLLRRAPASRNVAAFAANFCRFYPAFPEHVCLPYWLCETMVCVSLIVILTRVETVLRETG